MCACEWVGVRVCMCHDLYKWFGESVYAGVGECVGVSCVFLCVRRIQSVGFRASSFGV